MSGSTGGDPFGGSFDRDPPEVAQLRERRTVALTGQLDDAAATTVAAELMALDATGLTRASRPAGRLRRAERSRPRS